MTQDQVDEALTHIRLAREALERVRHGIAAVEIDRAQKELLEVLAVMDGRESLYVDKVLRPNLNRPHKESAKEARAK